MPTPSSTREPEITDALVAAHGLKPDEYQRILDLIGRDADADRARHLLGDVERALLLQVVEEVAAHAADHRPAGDLRPRRERRRRRHRRRPGAGLQDGEPQPPLLHRALPGRGDRRRRHPARRLHHGRAADRGDERAVASASRRIRRPAASCTAWSRASAATATAFGVPTIGGELRFHAAYNGNCLVNAFAAGLADADAIFYSAASGVGMPVVYLGAKTGRDGVGGATMASRRVRRHDRGEAPDGAGRRPLHREAADGGLPRADGDRRGDLDPGHGRRRPHLLGGRDGRQGRPRHPARPRPRAGARGGHDRLRDDAVARARSGC